jgi:hypothetical protein
LERRGFSARSGALRAVPLAGEKTVAAKRAPRSPPRATAKPAAAATKSAAARARICAGPRAELADPPPVDLVVKKREGPSPELRRHGYVSVGAERLPRLLDPGEPGGAARAAGQVPLEVLALGGVCLPEQAVQRAVGQFTTFHKVSPSENRAFRVSTARKMRVLTAPTEIPRMRAISA